MSNGRSHSGGIGGGLVPKEGFLGSSLLDQADLLGDFTDLDVMLGLSWGGPLASGSGFPDPSRFGLQSAAPIQAPPSTIIPNSGGVTPSLPTPTTLPQFSTLTADALTGTTQGPLVGTPTSTSFSLQSSPSPAPATATSQPGTPEERVLVVDPYVPTAATSSPNLGFAVRAEGTVTINGNSDFDGDPLDLSDDALIYAGNGFTINGRPALPVQLDEFGQPVLDGNGRPLLVENAVAVSANYSTLNAPNNTYGNLIPPQIVEEQVVGIPDFDTLKAETLGDQIPAGTTPINFNPYQNPLNNASNWAQHFPAGGTPEQPTVVKVSGWGLNIPGGVTIENTVIELENGYLNFNGNGHQLNNVTLVTHNGGMNLGNIQGTDLTILSSQSINMNGGARFGGTSLIATGNNQSIHFNGATQTTDPDDVLTVISQRDITFNGSTDTRGHFLSVNNFTLNGNSTIYGSIGAKGNVIFNGNATVIGLGPTTPSNTAPTDLALDASTISENVAANSVVGQLNTTDPDAGDTFIYSLVPGSGDTDNAAFSIVGDQLQINAAPDFETQDSYSIRVQSIDQGGLSVEKVFTVSITDINEQPTQIALSQATVAEQQSTGTVIGQLTSLDPDGGDIHTYELVDNAQGRFQIVGDQLQVADGTLIDFETATEYNLTVRSTDAGGLSHTQAFTITVTDINEAPTEITLSPNAILENSPDNSLIGSLSTDDPDQGDTHTYELVSGTGDTDNAAFTLTDDQLYLQSSPDFETQSSYSLRVRSTDADGLSIEKVLTVQIDNANEAPTQLLLSNTTVDENSDAGTVIGTFTIQDPDANDTHTYELVEDVGNHFQIVGDQLQVAPGAILNFELGTTHEITVQTTDAGGLSTTQQLQITVADVNEAPQDITLTPDRVAENEPINTLVGQFNTLDPEATDTHTYELVSGTGDTDNGAFTILGDQLFINDSANFETQPAFSILVRSTDTSGLSLDKVMTISTTNVNEAPTEIILSADLVAENSSDGTVIGTLSTADPDAGDSHTYSLLEDAGGRFQIVGNQLQVADGSLLNFELATEYTIEILSADAGGLSRTQQMVIRLEDINEAPTDLTLDIGLIPENTPANTPIGEFRTLDVDAGDSHTYTFVPGVGDTDNDQFLIQGDQLLFQTSPNFEVQDAYSLRVRTTDQGGEIIDKVFTISITDVNEAPTSITLSQTQVNENSASGSVIGELSSIDPEAGDTHTYELVDDAGGRFQIVDNQLIIAPDVLLDFEANPSHTVTIRSTDNGQPPQALEQSLVITVTDVNEAPVFTSSPVTNIEANQPYTYTVTTSDPENDPLTLSASTLPSWLTFVDNGDGTATVSGTPTPADLGLHTFTLTATDDEGASSQQTVVLFTAFELAENNDFAPQETFSLLIPETPSQLSFKINPLTFDESDIDAINDAFEVDLVDDQGQSLVHTFGQRRGSFFNWTEGEGVQLAPGVTYDETDQTVTLNLKGVAPGTPAYLAFRLVNNDGDTTTTVRISDLTLTDLPSGATVPLSPSLPGQGNAPSTIASLASLTDVSPSVAVEYQGTSFEPESDLLLTDVVLRNIGTYGINGPLVLVVKNISDLNVQLRDADGLTADGLPYYDFTHLLVNGQLNPEGVSASQTLVFANPDQVQFTYELEILADLNRIPVIESNPVTPGQTLAEGIIGQPYTYQVRATDADGDDLTYQLLSGPTGMTIDAQTGLIEWSPDFLPATEPNTPVGHHAIQVAVSDGRGGTTQQSYTLSITEPPPNRPPLFTSDPVVDAYINQLYQYDANAIDPDNDDLTFNLILGPEGFTIQADTGLAEFTPPPVLVVGDTVLGRIRIPGDRDEFSFSGSEGQTIFFDALQYTGDFRNWNFEVFSPSGVKVADSTLAGDQFLQLAETGNYRIAISTDNVQLGNYGFRVIDHEQAPVIPLDTTISGDLGPGTQSKLYRFTGNQGQKLFIDALNKSGTFGWTLYNSSNRAVASSSNFSDLEVTLPGSGDYTLALQGRSGFTGAASYSFRVITPDLITQSMALDTNISGSISEKGEQDIYTFTGTAGQQLYFDSLFNSNFDIRVNVYDPNGLRLVEIYPYTDYGPDRGLTLSTEGQYRVVVDGIRETRGSYQFRFLDRGTATTVNLDEDITGNWDNTRGATLYQFSLDDRQYIYFDSLQRNGSWTLYRPNGQPIRTQSLRNDTEFALGAGDYLLAIQGSGSSNTSYGLRMITPEFVTETLAIDEVISSATVEKGEQDTYTFWGTAGQQVYFDALTTDTRLTNNALIYDPNGQQLTNVSTRNDSRPVVLTQDGQYRLVIDTSRDQTGGYQFRLLDRALATEVNLDEDITGTLDFSARGTHLYRFTLDESQYLYFDGLEGNGRWTLYDARGLSVESSFLASDKELSLSAGEYLIAFQGAINSPTPNYGLRITTPDFVSTTLSVGDTISGEITEKGERDTFTFTGVAGQQLFFDALGIDPNLTVSLFDVNGQNRFNITNQSDLGPNSFTLTTSGSYRLMVDGSGEATGSYQFRLLDKATAPQITADTTLDGTLINPSGADIYRLEVTERQRFNFSPLATSANQLTIYSPTGSQIESQALNSDLDLWLNSGEHLLAVQGNGSASPNYELGIQFLETEALPPSTATPLDLNTIVNGTINTSGATQSYRFTGTAGQQLFYDALGGSQFRVRLIDPDGTILNSSSNLDSRNDHGPNQGFVLATDGEYTLTIGERETGNYSFRLWDRASTPTVTTDTDITGTIDANGLGSSLYQFSLSDTQFVYMDVQRADYTWSLYRTNGQQVIDSHSSIPREFSLGAGDYLLAVNGRGTTASYRVNLVTPDFGTASINIGEVVTGTLAEQGEQDRFTFSGVRGQQIFFDALGGSALPIQLIDPSGRRLFDARTNNDRGPSGGLQLTVDGEYQLVIDGVRGQTGGYAFRLLDQTLATEVALDTDITGTFDNNALGATLYTFNLDQSRYLFVNGLQGNGIWDIYRANGQLVTSGVTFNNDEFSLGAGDYLLALRGRGTDADYTLNIITPELVSTPMTLGQTVSGTIDEKGEQDTYTFSGTAGQQLFFDALGGSRFRWQLRDPNGRQMFTSTNTDSRFDREPFQGLVLSTNGTYRLTIDGYDEGRGSYSFKVLDNTAATTINLDTDILGTFEPSTRGTTLYKFDLDQRQYVYFDGLQGNANWILYSANGQKVDSSTFSTDEEFWLDAGNYLLAMQGTGAEADYGLRLITPDLLTTSLSFGDDISGSISEKGEQDIYTFEGQAGQKLFFDALGGSAFRVKVLDDTGRQLYDSSTSDSRINRGPDQGLTLTKTGTYRLIVDGDGENTGEYGFRLLDHSSAPVLPLETEVTGVLDNNGLGSVAYQFRANKGERFYLDTGGGQANNNWALYGPGGQQLQTGSLVDGTTDDYELTAPGNGDYFLVVQGQGAADPNYRLKLTAAKYDLLSLTYGDTVAGAIQNPGDRDIYSFTGEAGQSLFFDTLSGSGLTALLYGPDQALLTSQSIDSDWASFKLFQTGAYELLIRGDSNNLGDYSFSLRNRENATALLLDTTVTGALEAAQQAHLYKISGYRGQHLNIDLNTPDPTAQWTLYGTNGQSLASSVNGTDGILPLDGAYTLAISGSNTAIDYSLNLTDTTPPLQNTGLNTIYSGGGNGSTDFTFTATAGTQIIFDGLAIFSTKSLARLSNPDGSVVFTDHNTETDTDIIRLTQTGTYTIQLYNIRGFGNQFQLLEVPASLDDSGINLIEGSGVTTGTVDRSAAKILTIAGRAGQRLLFNGIQGFRTAVSLFSPLGTSLFATDGAFGFSDQGPITLTEDGLYQLALYNTFGSDVDYSFQILDLSTAPEINFGQKVNGRLADGRDGAVYQLSAKAGQVLYFDSLRSNTSGLASSYRWQLYDANNQVLFNQEQRTDASVVIQEDGPYYLYIQGQNAPNPLDYGFQVWASDPDVPNIITPGTGESQDNADGSLGTFAVKIQAEDTAGNSTTQSFALRLWPNPDNDGPIITSTPITQFGLADEVFRYQLTANDPEGDPLVYKLLDAPLGAVIDQETGELLWYPNTSVTAGSTAQFSVQVDDRFGNSDQQTFEVDVVGQLGKIQGVVFSDLNNNGYRDTSLVQGDSPDVVFAIDVSGSTGFRLVDLTTQDISSLDETTASILDLELATTIALSEQLISQGLGNTAKIGVVLWDTSGRILDMDLSQPGIQLYTTPLADNNNNGILDVREALETVGPGGFTDFTPGLTTAKGVLDSLGGDPNLIFLSDGRGDLDETIVTEINEAGINLTAFGIGAGSSLDQIQKVDPNAIQISNVDELVNIFSGWDPRYSVEPLLENITVYLDHNNNGVLDPDEPYQLTQPDSGNSRLGETRYYYSFENLLPGTYTVRQVVPNGYEETNPSSGSFVDEVTVSGGEVYEHLFGLHPISGPANSNPVFITDAPTTPLQVGDEFIYRAIAQDPDADPIRYDLPLAPDGVTIDESGNITWIPQADQVGRFDVILRVRDDQGGITLQTFELVVESNNQAPTFTSVLDHSQPQVGKAFQYQAKAIDADGDVLTYELVSGPSGVTLDSQTGLLNWTPVSSQLGNRTVQLRALDGQGGEAIQTLDLRVINPLPNQAPTFTSSPRERIRLGNTYFYQVNATDADGDPLSYSLSTAPTGMALQDNILVWTPTADQMGEHQIVLSVDDGQGGVAEQTYTLMVGNQLSNAAPEITSTPNLVTNIEREYQYNLTGTDPDGDLVQWRLVNGPEGVVVDPTSGSLRWQPTVDQLGAHTLIVELSDAYGLSTQQTFEVQVNGANTPPAFLSTPSTRAAQDQAYSYQVIAQDPEQDELTYSLGINPAGMTIDAQSGLIQWTPEASQLGMHEIEVQVRDSQGAVSTQTYQLEVGEAPINQAPTITSRPLFQADLQQPYTYQIEATDPEGGVLSYQLLEGPAGITVDAQTGVLAWDAPVAGDHRIVVAAYDAEGLGAAQGYTLRALANELPVIRSTPETTAFVGGEYRYDVQAQDPEGGALTYELDANAQALGVTIDAYGRISWTPTADQVGLYPITLTVTDAAGASVEQQFDLTVQTDDVAPEVRLVPSVEPAALGESVSLFASATDNVGVDLLSLTVNGQAVALDANGIYTFTPDAVGDVTAIATATDAAGNTTQTETIFSVLDLTDVDAPEINLPDLGGQVFTAPTEIVGTVNDDNLVYYSLSVAKVGSDDFREIFRGSDPVVDGVLGTFDPSLLENDAYTLRLTAVDAGGNVVTQDEIVSVADELKLGNFQLSFTDLIVPVTGIPISVTRTYDTLTSNTTDDFGYGWRLEFRDTDLRTSLAKDETFEPLGIRTVGFEDDTRVYITLPGGQRQGFTFKPILNPEIAKLLQQGARIPEQLQLLNPAFESDNGVTSTLSVRVSDTSQLIRRADGVYINPAGQVYNPADSYFGGVYVLTTKEGIVYEIDGQSGDLLSATDTNGNTLTYTDSAITSSTGQQVMFERDAQGRITTVTDPLGNQVTYEYDALGDLVAVTDRERNVTQFKYDDTQPHYLDEIIDPLNRTLARTEYNEQGQLDTILDVNGNSVEFSYDPANSLQTVKDALGNETSYEYDPRGNVVSAIDALGNISRFTYDDSNNVLTQTDPLGNTTSYTYDDRGNVTSRTTPTSEKTYYAYNQYGQLNRLVLPTGASLELDYDYRGNLLSVTDGEDNVAIAFTYNSRGQVLTETDTFGTAIYKYDLEGNRFESIDPDGSVTNMEYDPSGLLVKITEDDGNVSTFTYDKQGRQTQVNYSDGIYVNYGYTGAGAAWTTLEGPTFGRIERKFNDNGQIAGWITADGNEISYDYDALGRLSQETDPSGRITEYFYDAAGRLIRTRDVSTGAEVTREYDAVGRVIRQTDALGNTTTNAYHSGDGRLASVTDARGNTWSYSYNDNTATVTDPLGRKTVTNQSDYYVPTHTLYSNGSTSSAEYLFNNNLQEATDFITRYVDNGGNDRQLTYDELGRLATVTDLGDNITTYSYSKNNLTSIIGPTGTTRSYSYDSQENLSSIIYGDGTVKQFTYNSENRLSRVTLASGEYIDYEYDEAGRPVSQTSSSGEVISTVYTENGSAATVTNQNGTTTYLYDNNGGLSGIDAPNGSSIRYERDLLGRVIRLIEKASVEATEAVTQYTYDEVGNLKTVIDPLGGETVMAYDAVNRLTLRELPNGVRTIYGYNDLDQIVNLTHLRTDGTVLASFSYERNGVGEPTKITREDGSYRLLGYDASLRLISENYHEADGKLIDEVTYTYDVAGNRTAVQSNAGRDEYSYGSGFQLTGIQGSGGSETYSHDSNGRLTEINRDGEVLDLDHDVYDRLQQVENQITGDTTQYLYDGEGRRIGETGGATELRYLIAPSMGAGLDVQDLIVDEQGNLLSNHVYVGATPLLRLDAEGNPIYYLTDAMGSVVELADNAGQTVAEYDYDGFGNVRTSTGIDPLADVLGGDYRFQSQWLESETGLHYFRARDYDSQTGRFISRDPVDIIALEPESFNPYQFVYNNPYLYSDPTGEITINDQNAARVVEDILRGLQQEFRQELTDKVVDEAKGVVTNILQSTFKKLLPFEAAGTLNKIQGSTRGGLPGIPSWEGILIENTICSFLDYGNYPDHTWKDVNVSQSGEPGDDGYKCGQTPPLDYTDSKPDFIIKRGGPSSTDKRPKAYLIGDAKKSASSIKSNQGKAGNQFRAIISYADRKNEHQFIPVATYITIFDSQKNEKKLKERANKKGVYLFVVSFFPER
ncbi:putative Ig domain-containing protein [Acaryochloris marina NIES-2412]|uniref:putative Ig domain-containing protein n=1 Tax=Acaryochloris marina TaxID=155978 RepID=UPI0040588E76